MDPITIKHTHQTGWIITQGNKISDKMDWGEMMTLLASLTMPEFRPCLHWMKEIKYEVKLIAEAPKE